MARGVDGRDIFRDDQDRTAFLDGLTRIGKESAADIVAYCLMGNHFHLAIKVGLAPLASVMQRILTSHSLTFNRRHNRTGHLFQARYKAILCLNDAYLLGLIRYIHMNPVRAGLVARPQDWRWSSFNSQEGPLYSEEDIREFDPWPKEPAQNNVLTRDIDAETPDLADIGSRIATLTGIGIDEMRSNARRRDVVAAKRLLTQEAARSGHQLVSIARWLNSTPSSLTRYAQENTANTGKPDTSQNSFVGLDR